MLGANLFIVLLVCSSAVFAQNFTLATVSTIGTQTQSPFRRAATVGFKPGTFLTWGGIDETQVVSASVYKLPMGTVPPPWVQITGVAGLPTNGIAYGANAQVGNYTYVYGGLRLGAKLNTLYKISMDNGSFEETSFSNNYNGVNVTDPNHGVLNAMGACAVADDTGKIYLFGGLTDAAMLNLPSVIDTNAQTFNTITNEDKTNRPTRRYGSQCFFVKKGIYRYMVVFGGYRQLTYESHTEVSTTLNDRYHFNINNASWVQAHAGGTASSTLPSARAFASVTSVSSSELEGTVMYGGIAPDSTFTYMNARNDYWLFNHTSLSWRQISLTNPSANPSARGMHSAFALFNLGEKSIVFYGGFSNDQATLNTLFKITFTDCPYGVDNCGGVTPGTGSSDSTSTSGVVVVGGTTSTTGASNPSGVGISAVPFVNADSASQLDSFVSLLF